MSYHTNQALLADARAHAARAGGRAEVREPGATVEGRPILAVVVAAPGRTPDPARPQALVTANLHGNEVISSELAHRLVDLLTAAEPGPPAAALLDLADVTVVPAINLDSRERAARPLAAGRFGGRAARANARGVDLNRNFPLARGARDVWHPLAGTRLRWLPWYRGAEPFSEPETRAVRDLAEALRPAAAIHAHSVGRLFLYPWCCQPDAPPDLAAYLAMGEAFRAAQPRHAYTVKQARAWYTVLGDLDDWLYDRFGTLSMTLELSRPLAGVAWRPWRLVQPLAWMNPPDPGPTVANTAEACLRALAEAVRRRTPRANPNLLDRAPSP